MNANKCNLNTCNLDKYKVMGLTLIQLMTAISLGGLLLTLIYKLICG